MFHVKRSAMFHVEHPGLVSRETSSEGGGGMGGLFFAVLVGFVGWAIVHAGSGD